MYSRAEDYRCRGIEAELRAAQATTPNVRLAFEEVALGWFLLAGQANCGVERYFAAALGVSGHASLKEVQRYTQAFDRKRLAARAQAKVAAANNVVPLAVAAR